MATAPRRARSRRQGDEQPSPVPQDTPNRSAPSEGVACGYCGGDPNDAPHRVLRAILGGGA